jgi:hypothetical protein
MVSAESFGELRLFNGTLFTFYRSSDNPLEGVMTTLWEMEMKSLVHWWPGLNIAEQS